MIQLKKGFLGRKPFLVDHIWLTIRLSLHIKKTLTIEVKVVRYSSKNNNLSIPKTMKALPLFHPYGSSSVPV